MSTTWFASPQDEISYIKTTAKQLGVDPEAALAVAAHEGITIPSEVGDQGTSFGPWQLHLGGKLPTAVWQQGPAYAEQWANSQAGINYALEGIANVSRGQTGQQAVDSIVSQFEQPTDIPGEEASSWQTYQQGGGPSTSIGPSQAQNIPGSTQSIANLIGIPGGSGVESGIKSASGSVGSALSSVESGVGFLTSWRFAEIVGGGVLVVVGLILMARRMGFSPPGGATVGRLPGV